MSKTEAKHWTLLRARLKEIGFFQRIENISGEGVPDVNYAVSGVIDEAYITSGNLPKVNYAVSGVTGWIETKVAKSGKVYFEKFQLPWHSRFIKHTDGKHMWVVVFHEDEVIFVPARVMSYMPRQTEGKWTTVSLAGMKCAADLTVTKPVDIKAVQQLLLQG